MKGKQTKEQYYKKQASKLVELEESKRQLEVALQEIERLKEQVEEHVHNEISLRAETKRAIHEKESQQEKLEQLERENTKWKAMNQERQVANEALSKQLRDEADLINQIKAAQKELSDYKMKTLEVLSLQKEPLEELSEEHTKSIKKMKQLSSQLIKAKKEEAVLKERLDRLRIRHNQLMNTKMMKWTGAYWKLRKKITLKSK
ncbi:hypothetical protein [Listeria rustica]|uniref:Uncharacterized protein n=1 Tax=Listeria rustica TaxID=2713503 RepID=A0A7W1T4M3_9LIST|nr:hypothetical protein [Listeria rustica]MBA3925417.1 hypothetical protein [Listeria rustica]